MQQVFLAAQNFILSWGAEDLHFFSPALLFPKPQGRIGSPSKSCVAGRCRGGHPLKTIWRCKLRSRSEEGGEMNRSCATLTVLLAGGALAMISLSLRAQDLKRTADIAVVVNSQNKMSDIKLTKLRKLMLGEETSWPDHLTVVVLLHSTGTPEQTALLRNVVQMNATQYRQYWMGKVFRGEASAEPVAVPSNGLASEFVATHPGAITLLRGSEVRRDLKVLKVEGILPGEEGYPLH